MKGVSVLRLVTFLLFVLGTGCFLVAFCTLEWYRRRDQVYNQLVRHGLWTLCDEWYNTQDKCRTLVGWHVNKYNGGLRAVQGLMCVSVILIFATMVSFMVWFCEKRPKHVTSPRKHRPLLATLIICLLTGVCNFIAIIVFGARYAKYEDVLSWSYGLAVVSSGLFAITGLTGLIFATCCIKDTVEPDRTPNFENRMTPFSIHNPLRDALEDITPEQPSHSQSPLYSLA